MNYSFGELILTIYTLVDGKSLSYGYSNQAMPDKTRRFQTLFRSKLASYIDNHNEKDREFLSMCVEHINDINNEEFSFLEKLKIKV